MYQGTQAVTNEGKKCTLAQIEPSLTTEASINRCNASRFIRLELSSVPLHIYEKECILLEKYTFATLHT